jgi:hypothetical protein
MGKYNPHTGIKKITSAIDNVIPEHIKKNMNPITPVPKSIDKIIIPEGIKYIFQKIEIFKETLVQIHQAVRPYLIKTLEIGLQFKDIFEKQNYNLFLFRQSILEMWNDIEKELKSEKEHNFKSDFLTIFEKCAKETNYKLKKGTVLYRSRKIELSDFSSEVRTILNTAIECFHDYDYQKLSEKEKDIWNYVQKIAQDEWEQDYINKFQLQKLSFWGFDEKGSDAPPEQKPTQGRANSKGISPLYTARDLNTAISEIRPTIEQTVSVAEIKTLRSLKLFNFDFDEAFNKSELFKQPMSEVKEQLGISIWQLQIFFDTISELFSRPSSRNNDNYQVPQYLSEHIRKLGFDGIKYKSSLKKDGSNIVLFDISKNENVNPKNYKILSSSLHKIENIKITSKILLPRKGIRE